MLSNVLVEYLLIELFRIFLSNCVIQSSSMRFNDVALARGGAVGQRVVLPFYIALKDFFMLSCRLLQTYKSFGWRGMLLIIWAFAIELSHYLVKVISVSVLSPV